MALRGFTTSTDFISGPKGYTPLNLFQGSLGRCRRRLINTTSTHKGRRMGPAYMVKLDFHQAALKSVLLPHDIIDLTTKESMIAYWGDFLENEELAKLKPPGIGFCWKGFRDLWRFMFLIRDDGIAWGCLHDYIDLDDNGDPFLRQYADAEPTRPHGSQPTPASSEQVAAPPNVAAAATDLPDKLASPTLQLSGARSPVMSNDQSSEQVAETTSPSSEQVAAPPNVAAAATDLPDKLASLTLQLSGARSPVTVSYTHLTLPTILRV